MKLSVTMFSLNHSYDKGETDIEDFINFCGTLGIQGVDLLHYYWKDRKAEMVEVPKLLKRNNLVLAAYATNCNFVQEDKVKIKEEIEQVKREIDTAAELKAPLVRIFAGSFAEEGVRPLRGHRFWSTHIATHRTGDGRGLSRGKTRKDAVDIVIEPIRECVDYAKNRGIILALENGSVPRTVPEVKYILDSINSPFLRANLDVGNFYATWQDPYLAVEELISYAVHVHYKDWECIDYVPIFRIFEQSGYDGFISLENHTAPELEKEEIKRAIDHAKWILRKISS